MIKPDALFKLLSDQTRLRVVTLLHNHGELCVCELTHTLGLSQPKISRHLAHLRDANFVTDRRQGIWIYYTLNQDLAQWVTEMLKVTINQLSTESPYAADDTNLKDMPNRPSASCCA